MAKLHLLSPTAPSLPLHSSPFIFIYGPPGSGKTTTARRLAQALSLPCLDLDAEIEQQAGCAIRTIFAQSGEKAFRRLETEALLRAISAPPAVIALGGGALLDPQNRQAAEAAGKVVCLSAPHEVLLRRTQAEPGQRPLLDTQEDSEAMSRSRLSELLSQRQAHYSSFPLQLDSSHASPGVLASQIQIRLGCFHVSNPGSRDDSGYRVAIQPGGLSMLGDYLKQMGLSGPIALVADSNVAPYYADTTLAALRLAGYQASLLTIPAGEAHKTLETVSGLWQGVLSAGLERRSTVVALGGGMTTDLAGFAAATYLRGIPWVAVPTTILAMADASIGGKTGFDLPQGKNLVGAFYSPRLVLSDPQTLHTLPPRELRAGLAEVVKAGLIADPALFELCAGGWQVVSEHLEEVISRSIAVKVRIVQTDPYEHGRRAALNLGHTLGHAVETASNYRLLHGEAIAIGLVTEARLAERIGLARPGLASRIAACLAGLDLPTEIPANLPAQAILQAALVDKKRQAGDLRFTLPVRPGRVQVGVTIPQWDQMILER